MRRSIFTAILLLMCVAPLARAAPQSVVLLHGMLRSPLSMIPMQRFLEKQGFETLNLGYFSVFRTIPEIGASLAKDLDRYIQEHPHHKLHFVGHSLGAILARWLAHHHRPANMGRIVTLAAPNQGAQLATIFAPYLAFFLFPLSELTTLPDSTVRSLPPSKDIEIGVIAGSWDLKVGSDETHIDHEMAYAMVKSGHAFIMFNGAAKRLTARFLRTGSF